MMTVKKQREIVIEYERIQLIRKRAKTELAHCGKCDQGSDFVPLLDAADLFGTTDTDLFHFISSNDCHYHLDATSRIFLCVTSLIESLKHRDQTRRLMA